MEILGIDVGGLIKIIETGLSNYLKRGGEATRRGLFFVWIDEKVEYDITPSLTAQIGFCSPDRVERYSELAHRTAHYLSYLQNRLLSSDGDVGGAVRINNEIMSIAGLHSEAANEALMLWVAVESRRIDLPAALVFATQSTIPSKELSAELNRFFDVKWIVVKTACPTN